MVLGEVTEEAGRGIKKDVCVTLLSLIEDSPYLSSCRENYEDPMRTCGASEVEQDTLGPDEPAVGCEQINLKSRASERIDDA
jgi:hypothetical protein